MLLYLWLLGCWCWWVVACCCCWLWVVACCCRCCRCCCCCCCCCCSYLSLQFTVGKNRDGGHLFFFCQPFLRLKLFDRQYVFKIFCPARSCSNIGLRKSACFMAQQTNLSLGFRVGKNRGGGHLCTGSLGSTGIYS